MSKRLGLDDQRWFNSEREVCNSFLPFFDQYNADEYHYEQSSRYLNKVGDTGIAPMKWYTWLGLSVMVLIEAAGFAYVLAGFTIQDGSESIQIQAAVGIALLISVLLVGFTHAMGGELYRNQQIGKVRLHWNHDPQKPGVIAPDLNVGLKSKTNALDDNQPSWRQMANRLSKANAGFTKSWTMSIVTIVFISIVAVGATYVRGQVLEKLAIEEISGHEQEANSPFQVNDPFAESAPAELTAYNDEAEDKAFKDAINAHKKGGWMTFIMLAVIFAAMQAYSIYLGFKSTFSGKESSAAYDATYKFSNVNAYIEYYAAQQANVERVAQSVLSHLQSKIAINAQRSAGEQHVIYAANNPSSRNFLNYYKLRALKSAETPELIKTQYHDYQPTQQVAPQVAPQPLASEPAYQPVPETAPQPTMAAATASVLSDVEIIHKVKNNDLDGLTDEQIVTALKAISNEPKPETAEERLARLQQQAMSQ
ncbi:hypothetical protein BIY21_08775 [Vibrio ponticus]|uniref:Uncharacterized protein n=1 Tax=Vibrio ponticus TaxID=265668 RepID=A0ABX3FN21_9VIBR|nr:hypothetical protein BIY21_08775 [Vibrio ponticus]